MSEKKIESRVLNFNPVMRYKTVDVFNGSSLREYELPVVRDVPYQVDDSCFSPFSEAVKSIEKYGAPSGSEVVQNFDFPDGKDTGISSPITRNPNRFSDITELSESVSSTVDMVKEQVSKARKAVKRRRDFSAKLDSINKGGNVGEKVSGDSSSVK